MKLPALALTVAAAAALLVPSLAEAEHRGASHHGPRSAYGYGQGYGHGHGPVGRGYGYSHGPTGHGYGAYSYGHGHGGYGYGYRPYYPSRRWYGPPPCAPYLSPYGYPVYGYDGCGYGYGYGYYPPPRYYPRGQVYFGFGLGY